MDMEVTSSSVVEPQSVPSRISVVLVEDAKVRGTECLVSPRAYKEPRLLAGVASLASVTVCEGGNISLGLGTVMDHVRGEHDVPWVVKSASVEQCVPPWTVRRQVWPDSLKASHSGISTDVLLFSDISLSLVHHYRIHMRGLPHIAFRKDYVARLSVVATSSGSVSGGDVVTCFVRPSVVAPCSLCRTGVGVAQENQTCQAEDAARMSHGGVGG